MVSVSQAPTPRKSIIPGALSWLRVGGMVVGQISTLEDSDRGDRSSRLGLARPACRVSRRGPAPERRLPRDPAMTVRTDRCGRPDIAEMSARSRFTVTAMPIAWRKNFVQWQATLAPLNQNQRYKTISTSTLKWECAGVSCRVKVFVPPARSWLTTPSADPSILPSNP